MTDERPGPDDQLTIEQAAAILAITEAHVRELVANGVITPTAAGGLSRDEVIAVRERRERRMAAADDVSDVVNRSRGGWGI